MKTFLLAGQSNMQGFGYIDGYPVLQDDRIFNLATGKAEVAVEPLHTWSEHQMPDGIGLGLAMPFALELLKVMPDIQIGFIPAAIGGSKLDSWLPGNDYFERAIELYQRAAQKNDLELAGILWHQGEGDSFKSETAQTYGERFKKTITSFRERLNVPRAPIVAGEIGYQPPDSHCYENRNIVVEQTKQAIASLGIATFVSSEGLECEGLHFTTKAIREFGLRYAKAYLELTCKN